jgi:Flp pilus assembly protein TadD
VRLILLGFALAMAGCASSGSKSSAPAAGSNKAGATSEVAALEVPPQAMTMYEQATAIMASGDYLDAELRLKEFLLQYPGYPGAHVNLAIIHVNNEDEASARAALDAALAINPE